MTEERYWADAVPETHRPYVAAEDRYTHLDYRRVGTSGLLLPPISLGLWWNFGDDRPFATQREIQIAFCSIDVGRLANGACGPVTTNMLGKPATHTPMIDEDCTCHFSRSVWPPSPRNRTCPPCPPHGPTG